VGGGPVDLAIQDREVGGRRVPDVARDEGQEVLEADDTDRVAVGDLTAPGAVEPALACAHHRYPIPVRSISGSRPPIRSATARLEPHAIVQPMWPWPVLKKRFAWRPRPIAGGPSGVIGRRHARRSPAA